MAQPTGVSLRHAIQDAEIRSWFHWKDEIREHGYDPEVASAWTKVVSWLADCGSTYRVMIVVHHQSSNNMLDKSYYYVAIEQWDHTYTLHDTQVDALM